MTKGIKSKDITGFVFGDLTVLKFSHYNKYKVQYWLCRCSCGKELTVRKSSLLSGEKTHCGCKNTNNLFGKRFGRLVVVGIHHLGRNNMKYWLCQCDCGKTTVVRTNSLLTGNTKSCGCFRNECISRTHSTHGLCKKNKRLYRCWDAMLSRCNNPKNKNYKNYGGRGITVYKEWYNPVIFYDWAMENGYRDDLTIDRIDNNKGYYPENCRWVTRLEQQHNLRSNIYVTLNGEKRCLAEWGRIFKKNPNTLKKYFIQKGICLERAIQQ